MRIKTALTPTFGAPQAYSSTPALDALLGCTSGDGTFAPNALLKEQPTETATRHLYKLLSLIKDNKVLKIATLLKVTPPRTTASCHPEIVSPPYLKDNCSKALLDVVKKGHSRMARILLRAGADVNTRDVYKTTLLHWAAFNGHASVMQTLLEHNASLVVVDQHGNTPLHLAAMKGHKRCIEQLVHQATHPNVTTRDALVFAGCRLIPSTPVQDKATTSSSLPQPSNSYINTKNYNGETPLHLAVRDAHTTDILLKNGALPNICNHAGDTPLHLATRFECIRVAQKLLNHGTNHMIMNKRLYQAIGIALENRQIAMVSMLMKARCVSHQIAPEKLIEQYHTLKRLGLHNGLSGFLHLHHYSIPWESFTYPCEFYRAFGQASHEIHGLTPVDLIELREAYNLVTSRQPWGPTLMDRVRSGKLTIIERTFNTKTLPHSVALVFRNGLLIRCERAQSAVFAIDAHQLTAYNPDMNRQNDLSEWISQLPHIETPPDSLILLHQAMASKPQKTGNCSSASFKLSIRAALLLIAYEKSKDSGNIQDLQKALTKAKHTAKLETLTLRQQTVQDCLKAFEFHDIKQVATHHSGLHFALQLCNQKIMQKQILLNSTMHLDITSEYADDN